MTAAELIRQDSGTMRLEHTLEYTLRVFMAVSKGITKGAVKIEEQINPVELVNAIEDGITTLIHRYAADQKASLTPLS